MKCRTTFVFRNYKRDEWRLISNESDRWDSWASEIQSATRDTKKSALRLVANERKVNERCANSSGANLSRRSAQKRQSESEIVWVRGEGVKRRTKREVTCNTVRWEKQGPTFASIVIVGISARVSLQFSARTTSVSVYCYTGKVT